VVKIDRELDSDDNERLMENRDGTSDIARCTRHLERGRVVRASTLLSASPFRYRYAIAEGKGILFAIMIVTARYYVSAKNDTSRDSFDFSRGYFLHGHYNMSLYIRYCTVSSAFR